MFTNIGTLKNNLIRTNDIESDKLIINCPRCIRDHNIISEWEPHYYGNNTIRYVCQTYGINDHYFDLPLCPYCHIMFSVFELETKTLISPSKKNYRYFLKCNNGHALPVIDFVCLKKKSRFVCGGCYKLQWSYDTMVLRCEKQKNRDHDLWWVKYKYEWKQRRTIIRYKKEFLNRLSYDERCSALGLIKENEIHSTSLIDKCKTSSTKKIENEISVNKNFIFEPHDQTDESLNDLKKNYDFLIKNMKTENQYENQKDHNSEASKKLDYQHPDKEWVDSVDWVMNEQENYFLDFYQLNSVFDDYSKQQNIPTILDSNEDTKENNMNKIYNASSNKNHIGTILI